jgi:hypothetical protein
VDAFFLFLLCAQKKKETKRKSAGCRSGAKFFTLSLKKKNSLTLKQLFLLHGKEQKILHAPPLKAGPQRGLNIASLVEVDGFLMVNICSQRAKRCCIEYWPHFFGVKRRCFSER